MNRLQVFLRHSVIVLAVLLLAVSSAAAQGGNSSLQTLRTLQEVSIPVRDAPDLAERLGGLIGAAQIAVPPAPVYTPGDRETFFVGNNDTFVITPVEAELAAATPGVYLWVEVGVPYDADLLADVVAFLDDRLFPAVRALFGNEDSPGIDGDPHIYILHATDIGETVGGYFNDTSVYPQQIFASSNEHEMFVIAADNVPFDSSSYLYVLAHEFVHMIQKNQDENEQTWVTEGTAELGAFLTVGPRTQAIQRYLAAPGVQLNAWDIDQPSPYYGAAALFFAYLEERFGPDFVRLHAGEPADGIAGIDRTLAALGAADPQTGGVITFAEVFADWLVANLLNNPTLLDGRFGYRRMDLAGGRAALTGRVNVYPALVQDRPVNQHGADYFLLESASPQTLRLSFSGNRTVSVVPTTAHSGEYMYWANRSDQSNPRLTRAFDLSGLDKATLTYWTWYEMEPFWDYGYVSASTDGGRTWTPLATSATTREDPNHRAFAPGITGYSAGGTETRPAPFLGITLDTATGLVTGLLPGGGAAAAGMQPGDQLLAIGGESLASADLVTLLNRYHPAETVPVTVRRGGQEIVLQVTLGEHPERRIRPEAAWVQETIDLTPFTGGEVLVRFEYVTDQAFTRNGWLLDDIAIPELGYFDDAELVGDWLAEGWSRITNALPQEFLVELVTGRPLRVQRLLMPGGGQTGEWTVEVAPDNPAVVIISGMTDYTLQPATYTLRLDALN